MELKDLLWVDEFIENVRPYIFVRTEDNLLIKRPNNTQKLNQTGARVLKALLDGASIKDLVKKIGKDAEKINQIGAFLCAVKQSLEGNLDIFTTNEAVDIEPFDMKFSDFPVLSELAITYRCNLACEFCYAGCNCTSNPVGNNEELSTQALKKIVDKIFLEAKVPSISFTGGEPTLRKDLAELIAHAKKHKMRVNLISNGSLIDGALSKNLKKAGLDSAQISLEGITAETHDKIVGRKGAFEKSLQAIELLRNQNIHTHTNTTLTKTNANEALKIPQFIKKLGFNKFSMNLIIPTGTGSVNQKIILKYTEVGTIIQQMIEQSKGEGVELMWYSPLPMCIFNTIPHGLGNKGCAACDGLISVAPNGDVLPCASYDESVGNLLEEKFSSIWHAERATFFRNKQFAHSFCQKCEHFHICNGACPLYWRQMGYKELDELINLETIKI